MAWKITGDRPIYQQLIQGLTERIVSGIYEPGGKVPAVRELAADAGVNPNTMQRALADLERAGLLYTQRTSGRFVTEDSEMIQKTRQELAAGKIEEFLLSMQQIGFSTEETVKLVASTAKMEGVRI